VHLGLNEGSSVSSGEEEWTHGEERKGKRVMMKKKKEPGGRNERSLEL